jgi:hypothetical protein
VHNTAVIGGHCINAVMNIGTDLGWTGALGMTSLASAHCDPLHAQEQSEHVREQEKEMQQE